MRKTILPITLLFLAIAHLAIAGVVYVPAGPVDGKWAEGDTIVVAGGAFVAADGSLEVDEGTTIFFESLGRFEVYGNLSMAGTPENPIVVTCAEGWRGFRLRGAPAWHTLNYVYLVSENGLPRRAVEVEGASLEMNGCKLVAAENCLRFVGGGLHARNNQFTTTRLYSKAVELLGMEGFASEDCEFGPGNIFRDNFIQAEVAQINPGDPIDPFESTSGLWIDYCTNICFTDNDITVRAPLSVIGIRFGNVPSFGDQSWDMVNTIVYAESRTLSSIGVLNEVEGDLAVSKMTITVRGVEGYASSCFFAARTSYIRISSTTTVLGSPTDIYYNTSGAGRIDANYVVKWTEEGETLDGGVAPGKFVNPVFEGNDGRMVHVGDSLWESDPMFAEAGEWGEWTNSEEVAAFFSLRPNSPCIDRGDPDLGNDPDNTRLDIGRFYYHQNSSDIGDDPTIVRDVSLGVAYPNPFNPSTVLPVSVDRAGVLRLTVWDVLGRVVYEYAEPIYQPGLQNVHFQASGLSSGMYLAQAEFNGHVIGNQRLMLVK